MAVFTLKRWLHRLLPPRLARAVAKQYYWLQHARHAGGEPELGYLLQLLRPGQRVLDIGANFGFYTIPVARGVGPRGVVHAFEPVPETCDVLAYVLRHLNIRNVVLHECAVAERSGAADIVVPAGDAGAENFYLPHLAGPTAEGGRRIPVRTVSLDEIETELEPVHAVKCDVEGAELAVLKGALETLRKHRPLLVLEVGGFPDRLGGHPALVWQLLTELGYRSYLPASAGLEPCSTWTAPHLNYFFFPPGSEPIGRLTGMRTARPLAPEAGDRGSSRENEARSNPESTPVRGA